MENLAVAAVVALWWIALWGLTDLLTEGWGRGARLRFYATLFALVVAVTVWRPDIVERF